MALFKRGEGEGRVFDERLGLLDRADRPAPPAPKRTFDSLDAPSGEVLDLRTEDEIKEKPAEHFVEKPKRGGQIFYSQAMPLPIAVSSEGGEAPMAELRQVRGLTPEQKEAQAQTQTKKAAEPSGPRENDVASTIGVAVAILVLVTIAAMAYFNMPMPALPKL